MLQQQRLTSELLAVTTPRLPRLAMSKREYNRNASSFEPMPPRTSEPTYAETLLYQKGFQFTARYGEDRIDLRAISRVDIHRIVKEVDIDTLQSFLEIITYADITEDDFDLYSNDCFVKLFQVSQLTLEYLLDVQDTLSANLNGLAKKYAAKKREMEVLSRNLAGQDAAVASLRDELHYTKQQLMNDGGRTSNIVARVDPSHFPSQQQRRIEVDLNNHDVDDEASSSESFSSKSSKPAATSNDTIQIHVVSSVHGKYLMLDVSDSITIRNLKELIFGQLDSSDGTSELFSFDAYAISHKGIALKDQSQTLVDAGVVDSSALILAPVQHRASPSGNDGSSVSSNVASKLQELIALSTTTQEELMEASRTLVRQASMQDEAKESFTQVVEAQLKTLEHTLIEEVQRRIHDVAAVFNSSHLHHRHHQQQAGPLKPSEQLVGDIESDDGAEEKKEDIHDDISTESAPQEHDSGESNPDRCVVDNVEFEPPFTIDCESPPMEINVSPGVVTGNDHFPKNDTTFKLPDSHCCYQSEASKLTSKYSSHEKLTPIPSQGYLDRGEKLPSPFKEEAVNESTDDPELSVLTPVTPPSLRKITLGEMEHFRFSEYESDDVASVDIDKSNIAKCDTFDSIPEATVAINAGVPGRALTADSDLQSIEVSQTDFESVAGTDSIVSDGNVGNKKSRFGWKESIKKQVPKKQSRFGWRKKGKKSPGLSAQKGKLYNL